MRLWRYVNGYMQAAMFSFLLPWTKMSILQCRNLSKSYGSTHALSSLDLELPPGRIVGLLGPNGSGKTTLLRCINFLEFADKGKIFLDGKEFFDGENAISAREIREMQKSFGLVFQDFNLFPQYNGLDNVTLAPILHAKERADYKQKKKQILEEIEANEYKDYILGFIFYKFFSDKETDFCKSKKMTDLKQLDENTIEQ